MTELGFCLFALVVTFVAGRRSLVAGLVATLAVGYGYGTARANFTGAASHFIFYSAALGLYAAPWRGIKSAPTGRNGTWLRLWASVLVVWPILLFFLPLQDPLIQIVGLRADVFFIPFLLLGTSLDDESISRLGRAIAFLNLCALLLAVTEYFRGVEL